MPKVVVKCSHCENGLMTQGSGRQSKINRFNLRFVIKLKNLFLLILSGLDFSGDPKKVTLQRMSEVVVTWCHYQSDHWPKSGGWRNCFVLSTRKMVTMKIIVTTSPGANTSVFFPVVQESMANFSHLRPGQKGLLFNLERPGSAFHRPVTYSSLNMPRFHWMWDELVIQKQCR